MEMWKFMADEGCQLVDDPHPRLKNQVCFKYRCRTIRVAARAFRNEEFMRKFFYTMKPDWDSYCDKLKRYDSPPA